MKKILVSYTVAVMLKNLGFNEICIKNSEHKKECSSKVGGSCPLHNLHCAYPDCEIDKTITPVPLPTHEQVVNWLEEVHNIHLDRIWYDDKVTPTRWVYHVDHMYAGSNYDEAILQALKTIKKK